MKQLFRRIIAVLMCLALIVALPLSTSAKSKSFVYTALGDSVAAGFGLESGGLMRFLYQNNYYQFPEDSYPRQVGDAIGATTVYNLGIEAAWSTDYTKMLLDPDYYLPLIVAAAENLYPAMGKTVDPDEIAAECRYHQSIVYTVKQADLLTIELGGNDLMQGLLLNELSRIALGVDFSPEAFENAAVVNPIAYFLLTCCYAYFISGIENPAATVLSAAIDVIKNYGASMRLEQLAALQSFLQRDNMLRVLKEYSESVAASYDRLIDMVQNGTEITAEQYAHLRSCYAAMDKQLPTASKTTAQAGQISEYTLLSEGRLNLYVKNGHYYIAPINPDVEIILVGLYNPYGNSYTLDAVDYAQMLSFMAQGLSLLSDLLRGQSSISGIAASVDGLIGSLPAYLLYSFLGQTLDEAYDHFNELLSGVAERHGNLPFVDLTDLPCDGELDMHPTAVGHTFIARKLEEVLLGKKAPVACINGIYYDSLAEAVDAAVNGDKILLVGDCSENILVSRTVSFTFAVGKTDFSGKIAAAAGYINNGDTVYYSFAKIGAPQHEPERIEPSPMIAPPMVVAPPWSLWGWRMRPFGIFLFF